jgi:hypothetical protein
MVPLSSLCILSLVCAFSTSRRLSANIAVGHIAHPRRHAREATPLFLKDRFWLPLLNQGGFIALFSDSQNLPNYYCVNIFGIWHLNFRLFC